MTIGINFHNGEMANIKFSNGKKAFISRKDQNDQLKNN